MQADPTLEDVTMTLAEFEQFVADQPDDGTHYELIEGKLYTMPPPELNHSTIAAILARILGSFVRAHKLGRVGVEVGYKLDPNKKNWIEADVSYYSYARFPRNVLVKHLSESPDIAIEVLSPGNVHGAMLTKIQLYVSGGAQLVWLIDPRTKQVFVFRPDRPFETLGETDTLTGDPALPGFSINLKEFWDEIDGKDE